MHDGKNGSWTECRSHRRCLSERGWKCVHTRTQCVTLFKLNHNKLHKTFKLKPEVQMSHRRRRRRHFGPDWTLLFISFLNFPTCHSAELREEVQYRRLTAWQQVLETLRMCFQLDETRGRKKEKKKWKDEEVEEVVAREGRGSVGDVAARCVLQAAREASGWRCDTD